MEETLALLQKLGGASFATLAGLILIGSYFDIWRWSRQAKKTEDDLLVRLSKAEADAVEWKQLALQLSGVAKTTTEIAKAARV